MHRLLIVATIVGALACAAILPRAIWAYNGCGGIPVTSENTAYENETITLINQARANPGSFVYPNYEAQPVLTRHAALAQAAIYYSQDMRDDNYVDPNDHWTWDKNGKVPDCGPATRIGTYVSVGYWSEAMAWGWDTPQKVVQGWMDSTVHRNILMSPNLTHVGVGYAAQTGGQYRHLWTADFAAGIYEEPTATPTSSPTTTPKATPTGTASPPPVNTPIPTPPTVGTPYVAPPCAEGNLCVYLPLLRK